MGLFGNFEHWLGDRWGNGPSMSGLRSSVKGTGHFVGEVGQYAAPLVSVANPLLGAAIAGGSAALRGKSVADMLKDAAITGASGYALGHVGSFFGDAGEGAAGSAESAGSAGAAGSAGSAVPLPSNPTPFGAASTMADTDSAAPGHGFFGGLGHEIMTHKKDVATGLGQAAKGVLEYQNDSARTNLARRQFDLEQQQINEQRDAQRNRSQLLAALLMKMGMPAGAAPSTNSYYGSTP